MLTVWGRRTSSNVQAVMWCIGELDLEYERIDVGHRFGGNDTEQFLAMNPNGLVPVVRDGDGPALWESGAILRYLSSAYGGGAFWPADLMARAEVDRWAEWAKVSVGTTFTVPIFWAVARSMHADRDWTKIRGSVAKFEERLEIAEAVLSKRDYLAGEAFSLADIQLGHMLYRYYDLEIERGAFPALAQYYARLVERPAYREHVMVSYEDLRLEPR